MGEDLVARCEARHVLADGGDDAGRLDAERQRWSEADVPVADPDDLVPVADACRAYGDHDLVRRRRRWRREFEHAQLAAECVDARGLHPSSGHPARIVEP
jgi:hypothetical protein